MSFYIQSTLNGIAYYWTVQGSYVVLQQGTPDLHWTSQLGQFFYKGQRLYTVTGVIGELSAAYTGYLTTTPPDYKSSKSSIAPVRFEVKEQYGMNWAGIVETPYTLQTGTTQPRPYYLFNPQNRIIHQYTLGVGIHQLPNNTLHVTLLNTLQGFTPGTSTFASIQVFASESGTPERIDRFPDIAVGPRIPGKVLVTQPADVKPLFSWAVVWIASIIILVMVVGIGLFFATRKRTTVKPFYQQVEEDVINKKIFT